MSDLKEVLRLTKRLEGILERAFGASGRGLHEKVSSIADDLPDDVLRGIRYIATIRNKSVHEEDYEIEDVPGFIVQCQSMINRLESLQKGYEQLSEPPVSPATICADAQSRPSFADHTYIEEVRYRSHRLGKTLMLSLVALGAATFLWDTQKQGMWPNLRSDVVPSIKQKLYVASFMEDGRDSRTTQAGHTIFPVPEVDRSSPRWRPPSTLGARKADEVGRYTIYVARPSGKISPRKPLPSGVLIDGEIRNGNAATGLALKLPKDSLGESFSPVSLIEFGYAVFLNSNHWPSHCSKTTVRLTSVDQSLDHHKFSLTDADGAVKNFFTSKDYGTAQHVRIVVFPTGYTMFSGDRKDFRLPLGIGATGKCSI